MLSAEGYDVEATSEVRRTRLGDAINTSAAVVQAIAAVIVLMQQNATWRLPLFIALSLGAAALAWPLARGWLRRWRNRTADTRVARREYLRFRELVQEFGRFVDTGTTDTLHYIVDRELSERFRGMFQNQPCAPTIHFWHETWAFTIERLSRKPRTLPELTQSISEFRYLVSSYYNYCIAPVFERLPQELRAVLNERDRRLLNGFQQRHGQFVQQYETFIRQFAASRPALKDAGHFLQHSNPL